MAKRPPKDYNTPVNLPGFFQAFPIRLKKPSRQAEKGALWKVQLPVSAYTSLSVCLSSKPLSHFKSSPM